MTKEIINQLVRDKYPAKLREEGKKPKTRKLEDKEFARELKLVLHQEATKFSESGDMKDLAGVLEVVHGILFSKGKKISELEQLRKARNKEQGGYKRKVYLEHIRS